MKKFLLNVGAEKAGTTWLYHYFKSHPEFEDLGKEWNSIQRDDLVPTHSIKHYEFKYDINSYFETINKTEKVTGDFTHYEGSTINIYKLIVDGLKDIKVQAIPVYIMRDPIERAWSSWNMLGGGDLSNIPAGADRLVRTYLDCKYIETIEALDSISSSALYFFYEDFFRQDNINLICNALGIDPFPALIDRHINKGIYPSIPSYFIQTYGRSKKNIEAVRYIKERFNNVPWNLENYSIR